MNIRAITCHYIKIGECNCCHTGSTDITQCLSWWQKDNRADILALYE